MRRRNFAHAFEAKTYEFQPGSNPLFPKKPRRVHLGWLAVLSLVAAVVVTGLSALIYGPWFRIETVTVQGTVTLNPNDISALAKQDLEGNHFLILPKSHRWFYSEDKLEQRLNENFLLDSVEVKQKRGELNISITEDVSMLALVSGDQIYLLNRQGKIIRAANENEAVTVQIRLGSEPQAEGPTPAPLLPNMPIIKDLSTTTYAADQEVYPSQIIENLLSFYEKLADMSIQTKVMESDSTQLSWFTVISDLPYEILFDAGRDIQEQSAALEAVRTEYFATQDEIDYIDVRFGERVYVK